MRTRHDRGRERIVLDGEKGVLLLDARGRPAAKLRVIDVDDSYTVSLALGSDRAHQQSDAGPMWSPEVILGVVSGDSSLRMARDDGKWLLLAPGRGLEQYP